MGNPAELDADPDKVPAHSARSYITDMLEELGRIARESDLDDLDAVLSMARIAARQGAGAS